MIITSKEQEYLLTNLKKIQANQDKFPEAIVVDFGSYLPQLVDAVEQADGNITFTKKETRLLSLFLEMALHALEKSIIPGYVSRSITPASKKKYKPYIDQAKEKRDMIEGLLVKMGVR